MRVVYTRFHSVLQGLTQYSSINSAAVVTTAHSPGTPLNSVQQSQNAAAVPSLVAFTGSEQYAGGPAAQVLYAVCHHHRSPHDAASSSSPGAASDMASPRAPAASQLSPAAGSPHWFAHSPPSPSRLGDVVVSGELSPAHASTLQQQFQQFSMASSLTFTSSLLGQY